MGLTSKTHILSSTSVAKGSETADPVRTSALAGSGRAEGGLKAREGPQAGRMESPMGSPGVWLPPSVQAPLLCSPPVTDSPRASTTNLFKLLTPLPSFPFQETRMAWIAGSGVSRGPVSCGGGMDSSASRLALIHLLGFVMCSVSSWVPRWQGWCSLHGHHPQCLSEDLEAEGSVYLRRKHGLNAECGRKTMVSMSSVAVRAFVEVENMFMFPQQWPRCPYLPPPWRGPSPNRRPPSGSSVPASPEEC